MLIFLVLTLNLFVKNNYMDFKKLISFIKKITQVVSNSNSEKKTENIMSKISDYVFNKWVQNEKIDLDSKEIKKLISQNNKIQTLSKEEILDLINKYKNDN
jgi:nicotinic acid mononucleotide adenylyltransferase